MLETDLLLSVLMPVRNEGKHLERTLEALRVQDLPSFEILLADGGSDDDTVAVARRMQATFPQLKVLYNPGRWSSAGRNVALRHARGKYTIVIDGHCRVPDEGYLSRVVEEFEESGAATLGRPQPLEHRSNWGTAIAAARHSRLGHNPDSSIYTNAAAWTPVENVAVAYRREVFFASGMFDDRFDACEDVEFNRHCDAAGFDCWFTPAIGLPYAARESLGGLWRQMARYGTGRARLAKVPGGSLRLPALAPPAFLLYLLVLPPLVLVSAWAVVPLIAWLLAIGWESRRDPLRLPFVFTAIHLGFGWGFLREYSAGKIGIIPDVKAAAARPRSPARYRPSSSPPLRLRRTG